ncbi:GNAT family N-acetyltransferase [Morganella psychrotolerans]|uniref:Acetyltransferase n=1 Tax=Morganella psychrotolerans TaxID=368603 RepID=A0A1B8HDS5_9GAMM|nr:GNAT family N-acetyltransferase [Morganella psychrotolerans]OBU07234.1 acetyltransferase [Morganella psychrotolerans]
MNIRSAQLNDTGRIAELYQQLFTEMAAFQPERWLPAEQTCEFIENALTDEKFHLLVAEQGGKIAGFVIAQTQETPAYSGIRPRRFGYIFDIVVDPAVRGQGTGKKLLSAVKAWSKAQEHTHLELSVLPENKGAMRLYEQEGYQPVLHRLAITL